MSALPGITGQNLRIRLFDASGTITSGGTAQIVLPEAKMRSSLLIENISDTDMFIEIGAARATAAITTGAVSSISVTNAGLGYSIAPTVKFVGGAYPGSLTTALTLSLPSDASWPSPQHVAKAHCVMTGSAPNMTISSIVIDDGGSGYQYPPYVELTNSLLDPWGAAVPSTTSGILLKSSGGSYTSNGTVCTTDQISIFCASSSKAFTVKYSF